MNWEKLIETKDESLSRGTVFRCPGKHPYEDRVDFLLFNQPDSPSGHSLLVSTGQKAGHILINLPLEAKEKNKSSISTKWLIENWTNWVYELGPEDVYFTRNYTIDYK